MLDPPSFSVMSPATATIEPTLRSNSPAIIVSERPRVTIPRRAKVCIKA